MNACGDESRAKSWHHYLEDKLALTFKE